MTSMVTRDGKAVSPVLADESAALTWLLKHQSMSTDWALEHEGYAIVDAPASEAERFFYENAGFSFNSKTETEHDGRIRAARRLADAEARLKAGPYFVAEEPDDQPWDGDVPYDGPLWTVSLYSVEGSTESTLLESMSGVACEAGDPYMRVVAAELAAESIPSE